MVQDRSGAVAVQVEIDMVGKVHHRRGVSLRREDELELVFLAPLVVGDGLQVAREASLSVLGEVHEFHSITVDAAFPDLVREALRAAVQVVGTAVHGNRVLLAVQRELAHRDAVRITAGHLTAAGAVADIAQRVLVSQHHVAQVAVLVRDDGGDDGGADIRQLNVCAGGVLEGIAVDFLSVRGLAPQFLGDFHIYCALVRFAVPQIYSFLENISYICHL